MRGFYITVIRVWPQLGPWIVTERTRKGVYLSHFQWLTEQSLKYWKEFHPSAVIRIKASATGPEQTINQLALGEAMLSARVHSHVHYEIEFGQLPQSS